MRILYVITKANGGGAQRYVFDLAAAARNAGHEVVVAYGEPGILVDALAKERIRCVQVAGLVRNVGMFREFRALGSLVSLMRGERLDVVHLNSSKAGGTGALAARLAGVRRIIFTAHGWAFNEDRAWWQRVLLFAASTVTVWLSHEVICVSHAVARAISRAPFTAAKLAVIYNGIAPVPALSGSDAREMLSPNADAGFWIGMLSELHPTKRVGDAIRAMPSVVSDRPDTCLVVLGEGEERHRLEGLIRELRLESHVLLAGFRSDARSLLPAFDLFVHASRSEALGFAVLEAGAAGLPVVATNVGGIPEIISDASFGTLVPAQDPKALADAIRALMHDPERRARTGENLKRRVALAFTKERMVRDTLSAYG